MTLMVLKSYTLLSRVHQFSTVPRLGHGAGPLFRSASFEPFSSYLLLLCKYLPYHSRFLFFVLVTSFSKV